jgi:hypothetical protein
MRPGLQELTAGQEELAKLEILLSRRRDLVTDQSRCVTRLRERLLSAFPALERVLDLNRRGPLTFISHYQRLAQIRRAGRKRLAAYLRNRGVQGAEDIADKALEAATAQSVTLPAEEVAARIVAELAEEILSLKEIASTPSMRSSSSVFSPFRRLGFSLAYRGWDRSSGRSSWSP